MQYRIARYPLQVIEDRRSSRASNAESSARLFYERSLGTLDVDGGQRARRLGPRAARGRPRRAQRCATLAAQLDAAAGEEVSQAGDEFTTKRKAADQKRRERRGGTQAGGRGVTAQGRRTQTGCGTDGSEERRRDQGERRQRSCASGPVPSRTLSRTRGPGQGRRAGSDRRGAGEARRCAEEAQPGRGHPQSGGPAGRARRRREVGAQERLVLTSSSRLCAHGGILRGRNDRPRYTLESRERTVAHAPGQPRKCEVTDSLDGSDIYPQGI